MIARSAMPCGGNIFSVFGPIKSSEWENKKLKNSTRYLIVNFLYEF